MKRTSLKDLAAALNLSEGTVSRALNGYADISESTTERVRVAASAMDYRPNQTARRLATGVAEAVAYVIPQNHSSIAEPFVSQMLQGLNESLSRRGWDLLVSHSPTAEADPKAISRLIDSGRVSGVVLSRPFKRDARIDLLRSAGFPFAVHGRSIDCEDYAWFDIDNELAYREAVAYLVELGHRRIGFIGAPLYYHFAQMRLDGYRQALERAGIAFDDRLIEITELTDDGGERAAGDLLDAAAPPTALVCVTDVQALGALSAVRSRGLVAGREVSVLGYDGLRFARHANPPLTTFAQPSTQAGRELGDIVLALIDGDDPIRHQRLRRANLVVRESVGPARIEGPRGDGPRR